MRKRCLSKFAWLAAISAATIACGPPEPSGPVPAEHVIFLSLDTLRRDVTGVYRSRGESVTPALDAFAQDAVVFEGARIQTPFTQPSHMSMFTGLYPMVHRVNGENRKLDASIQTLAEILQSAGFKTTGLVINYWLKGIFGFDRGFDRYELVLGGITPADRLNEAAFDALETTLAEDRRVFLFIQYFDAHSDSQDRTETSIPYYSPPRYREDLPIEDDRFCTKRGQCATSYLQAADHRKRKIDAREIERLIDYYERGVRYLDDELSVFFARLRELGIYDDALIIVTSDHGEEFREHGRFLHSQVYEESVTVPLMIKLPGSQFAGRRVEGLVESIDLLPTILAKLDLDAPPYVQGENLLPAIESGRTTRTRSVSQHKHLKRRFSITDGRYKLIHDRRTKASELYDLELDPAEKKNIASANPGRVKAMTAELDTLLAESRALAQEIKRSGSKDEKGKALLSSEEKDSLRALGYLEDE